MEATISIVDTNGAILGIVRSPDAPIFGTDVSLQKARTAAFFSSARAGALLEGNPSADVRQFAGALRAQAQDPQILNGKFAITARSIGHPDPNIRSDRIEIPTGERRTRLRYVSCPFAPFVGSSEQNVCQGI
jgi:hypothetical protein